jgi:hypothetical protein
MMSCASYLARAEQPFSTRRWHHFHHDTQFQTDALPNIWDMVVGAREVNLRRAPSPSCGPGCHGRSSVFRKVVGHFVFDIKIMIRLLKLRPQIYFPAQAGDNVTVASSNAASSTHQPLAAAENHALKPPLSHPPSSIRLTCTRKTAAPRRGVAGPGSAQPAGRAAAR